MSRLHLTTILIFSLFILTTSKVEAFTISKPSMNNLGLVGHWTFDGKDTVWTSSTAGTVTDASGNGNTGTLVSMNTSSAPTEGKIGQALEFDGSADRISVSGALVNDPPFTLAGWVKKDSGSTGSGTIVAVSNDSSNAEYARLLVTFDGLGALSIRDDLGNEVLVSGGSDLRGDWHHVAAVFRDTDDKELYVDGVLVNSSTEDHPGLSANLTSIGVLERSSNLHYMSGALDDVRIYNRALSAEEIKGLYSTAVSRFSASKTSVTDGLVGHWTFDGKDTVWTSSTAGTITDVSGNGNTGTITSMDLSSAPTEGRIGQAFRFDGTNDSIAVDSTGGVSDYPFSFSAWVKTTSNGHVAGYFISGSSNFMRGIEVDSTGVATFRVSNTTDEPGNVIVADGSWHHIVGVYASATDRRLYVDGVLDEDYVTSRSMSVPNRIGIGRHYDSTPSGYFNGSIDDVRVYNKGLSDAEVALIYNETAGQKINTAPKAQTNATTGLSAGLVGHWTFDGKDMLTGRANDISGNDNHGTLVNIATSTSRVEGKMGQGLKFDGVNDTIIVPSVSINSKIATVSFWLNWSQYANNDAQVLELSSNSNSNDGSFKIDPNSSGDGGGKFAVVIQDGISSSKFRAENFTRPAAGEWVYYAFVLDNSTTAGDIKVYVNGVEQETSVYLDTKDKSSTFITDSLYIMSRDSSSLFGGGQLDDIRIYNRELTSSEIQQIYTMGR